MEKVTPRLYLFLLLVAMNSCVPEEPIVTNPSQKVIELKERHLSYGENPEVEVLSQPSLSVPLASSNYSYPLFRQASQLGQIPAPTQMHLEQFVNHWTMAYPEPPTPELLGVSAEMSVCPWNPTHHLLRVGAKTKSLTPAEYPQSNYVVYLDLSSSMAEPGKLEVIQAGLRQLTQNLGTDDRIGIVAYGGSRSYILESTLGTEQEAILAVIDGLSVGGPKSNSHINFAYEMLQEHYLPDGHNRLILITDNNFDLGPKSVFELEATIQQKSAEGIRFSIITVGRDQENLEPVAQLAQMVRGTHHHLVNEADAEELFGNQRVHWYEVVKDARVQVSFNPVNVHSYRLLGHENRRVETLTNDPLELNKNYFGSGQSATLLFEIQLVENAPLGQFPLATFNYRYKRPEADVNNDRVATYMAGDIPFTEASYEHQFLAAVAASALVLGDSSYKADASLEEAVDWLEHLIMEDPSGEWGQFKMELEAYLEN